MMKVTKLTLDFDYDYQIIGISCHYKDYRLCHFLNKTLQLHLVKKPDHIIQTKEQTETSTFSFYNQNNQQELKYYFIANRNENGGFLIPEYRQADYLFIIENLEEYLIDPPDYLKQIKSIQGVLTAFNIEYNQLKNKSNLIFE